MRVALRTRLGHAHDVLQLEVVLELGGLLLRQTFRLLTGDKVPDTSTASPELWPGFAPEGRRRVAWGGAPG